jgi:hypothetical protein
VNWAPIDFEKLLEIVPPPMDEIGKAWVYTGLQDGSYAAKPALNVWDECLSVRKR